MTIPDSTVRLGTLTLPNPIITASGTFGYAREMSRLSDLSRLGAIVPKTITVAPRAGNRPPRTVETVAGLLNAIGLDNDGLEEFVAAKLPYLVSIGCPIIVSVAAKTVDECSIFAERLNPLGQMGQIAALELNISCPNVSGGVDFGTDPKLCEKITAEMRRCTTLPLAVKLSPNVTNIADIARAAAFGGADMICAVNTLYGLAVDWRRARPRIANGFAGYSGPAIKPVALRCVHQIYKAVKIPIIGIGGIESAEDIMEFVVAGASAVQIGTANFYRPGIAVQLIDELAKLMAAEGIPSIAERVGTLSW